MTAHGEADGALRPLRNVASTTEALREDTLSEEESRTAVVQIAAAVEMTLRRLLRDDEEADLQLRLSALAPDELRPDKVLAELRQLDRISIHLAAAIHSLFEARQQLRKGGQLASTDRVLAYQVADRLEEEASRPTAPPPADLHPAPDFAVDDDVTLPAAPPSPFRGRRVRDDFAPKRLVAVLAVVAALVIAAIWWAWPSADNDLAEGVSRFQMGAYEDAAAYFWRSAQANPRDPTPRLYLARIHRRLERPTLAFAQLDTARQIAPQDPDVLAEYGFLLLDTGNAAEAVEQFREALVQDGDSEVAWVGIVTALRADGRADAAERVLERAPAAIRSRLALPAASEPDTP